MNAADFLVANKEISLEIENKIREYYSVKPVLSITLNAFSETSETKTKKSKQ